MHEQISFVRSIVNTKIMWVLKNILLKITVLHTPIKFKCSPQPIGKTLSILYITEIERPVIDNKNFTNNQPQFFISPVIEKAS